MHGDNFGMPYNRPFAFLSHLFLKSHGGALVGSRADAQVIILAADQEELDTIRLKNTFNDKIRFESIYWVQKQAKRGVLEFTHPPKLHMRGRIPKGAVRSVFLFSFLIRVSNPF